MTRPFSRFFQAGPGDKARTANSKHFTTYRWLGFLTRDTKFYCCKKSVIFSNLTISLVLTTFCDRPKNFDSVSSSRKYGHVRWACELGMDPLRSGVGGDKLSDHVKELHSNLKCAKSSQGFTEIKQVSTRSIQVCWGINWDQCLEHFCS